MEHLERTERRQRTACKRGPARAAVIAALAAALLGTGVAPSRALAADAHDEVIPLVRRIDAYFRTHQVDGVTLDSRFAINPSEAIRQGVVCQLLAYAELAQAHPTKRFRTEVIRHADYLSAHLLEVNSNTPFDGMLGYSLVRGFEISRDSTHWQSAQTIIDELKAIPTSECILNGGLMVAMAMVEWAQVTGDADALQKGRDIIASVPPYQHPDGSFPHWCPWTEDIHYSGWMSQELILLQRRLHDPAIDAMLAGTAAFEAGRIDSTGLSHYEEPCPGTPGCWIYYDSYRGGCTSDYDTRGITVEPGYMALLFDHAGAPRFGASMRFLLSLETAGTFKDKWAYIEPPTDPQYPWSSADTSVANMSILFWSMASILTGHARTAHEDSLWAADIGIEEPIDATVPVVPGGHVAMPLHTHGEGPGPGFALGSPPAGATRLTFSLPAAMAAELSVFDVRGRRVRTLAEGALTAGTHGMDWDRRDAQGSRAPAGVYFARLRCAAGVRTARIVLLP